jgi:hypothetical protein
LYPAGVAAYPMHSLRFLSCAGLLGALVIGNLDCSSSNSGNGVLTGNGTFTLPASVTVGEHFTASFVAQSPTAYPNVQVLPVSTDFIAVEGPGSFVALRTGSPASYLYAISGTTVLDYAPITVEPAQ